MASVVLPASSSHAAALQPPAPVSSSVVVVKLSLRGETYRVPFPLEELTWRALEAKVDACYDDAHRPAEWALLYRDDEDDLVTVSSPRELLEAIRVFAELKEQPEVAAASGERTLHMHFHVVAKLSLKEQLAPVMQAVTEISEKMTRLAVDTRESLRKSSYVERGRESLYHSAVHTRNTLSSAGRGLSQRMRRASTVVVDEVSALPRRLRTRSRVSSRDVREEDASPQALMVTDVERDVGAEAAIEMDVVDLLARARAEEEEAERNAASDERRSDGLVSTDETATTVPQQRESVSRAVDMDAEDVDMETGHASDAETASTASEGHDGEWDIVPPSSPARPLSPFFDVEADDEVEVSFTRWHTQLATIRDVMPLMDTDRCVRVLDKHDGNLEAALLELTEL